MFLAVMLSSSCSGYLDIVPDNTTTLEDYFERKEMVLSALAKVYSYLPWEYSTWRSDNSSSSSWMLGDEWMGRLEREGISSSDIDGIMVMRGMQNVQSPILDRWYIMYKAIRSANIFIEYVDMAEDMTDTEKKDFKAQAKFLKAYFHFILLQQYGPIVIVDKSVPLDALAEDLFLKRSKLEDCFDFIIRLMDEAIPDLTERASLNDLGQVDQVAATAIKARVMLFRASPFYNGNSEYYGDFFDFDGQPFFPMTYEPEKWKDAIDAIDEAIALCKLNGIDLYNFDKTPFTYDRDDYESNETLRTIYDLRMVVVDPWNKGLVWGLTYPWSYGSGFIADATNIRLSETYGGNNATFFSGQWLCATYKMVERYYTKNGLPLDDDRTFDRNTMYNLTVVPGSSDPSYAPFRGIMQGGKQTAKMYMNREPRFYANLGITGGYWRAHTVRIGTDMSAAGEGGYSSSISTTDFFCTGIGVQKFVHPESRSGGWQRLVRYPYPIIRMADLYLMKAEALNEYLSAPNEEVYEAINKVRRRAGIPDVQEVWSNAELTRRPGRHLTKEGMREIILRERSIELAFEGSRFWDMLRHKNVVAEFSSPVMGWSFDRYALRDFFVVKNYQTRRFIIRDCLWPISLDETNKNANLIQNPGW
jgi:hypothetical protein